MNEKWQIHRYHTQTLRKAKIEELLKNRPCTKPGRLQLTPTIIELLERNKGVAEKLTLYIARQTSANTHSNKSATKNHNPISQPKLQPQNEYHPQIILTDTPNQLA